MENRDVILKMFTARPDNLLENKRVSRDWDRIMEVRERMSKMGRKSAEVQRTFNTRSTNVERGQFGEVSEVSEVSEEKLSEVNAEEKISLPEEVYMASIRRRLQMESLKILNIKDQIQMGGQDDITLKDLASVYGGDNVVQAFIDWAQVVKDNPGIRYPISAFLRIAPQILKEEVLIKPSQELQDLLDKFGEVAGNNIILNSAQRVALNDLLKKFTPELILFSFMEFYGQLTEYTIKFAAKDWTEGCEQRCRNNQKALEKQNQDEQIALRMEVEGRDKATAELGALQQKLKEDEKTSGGFMEIDSDGAQEGASGVNSSDQAPGNPKAVTGE
jgi:hypothetical protein